LGEIAIGRIGRLLGRLTTTCGCFCRLGHVWG
jgi:hypothetical protein